MAETLGGDVGRLCKLLIDHKRVVVRRAIIAWKRSPETLGEEIIALNDIDETLRNNCARTSGF